MIFQAKLINGIRQGATTKTVRPVLPSHPKAGPWKVGDVLQVKATISGREELRIEVQEIQRTTLGRLELADIRAAGYKHRDLFLEAWMNQTGTVKPPSIHKPVWLVTFATYSPERFLAQREPRDLAVKPSNRTRHTGVLPSPREDERIEQVVPVADEHGYVYNRANALDDGDEQIGVLPCLSEHEQREMSRAKREDWLRRRAPEEAMREIDSLIGRLRRARRQIGDAAGRRDLVGRVEARAKHSEQEQATARVLARDDATIQERAAARRKLEEAKAAVGAAGDPDDVILDILQTVRRLDLQLATLERKVKAA